MVQMRQHIRDRSHPMLIASRTILQQHREVTAVLATYGMFLSAVLLLAWAIS